MRAAFQRAGVDPPVGRRAFSNSWRGQAGAHGLGFRVQGQEVRELSRLFCLGGTLQRIRFVIKCLASRKPA